MPNRAPKTDSDKVCIRTETTEQLTYQEVFFMKKFMLVVICVAVFAAVAMAQTNTPFVGATWSSSVPGGVTAPPKGFTIDKLGAHQNGGRGCVGCHTPHSGGRGNGGLQTGYLDNKDDEILWGQDLTPVYAHTFNFPNNPDDATKLGALQVTKASAERQVTGIAMCLSCHDGNVAKGAMMTNTSFEQAAGMLPPGVYGTNTIPTLLGNDGVLDNYKNDHPVGPSATLGTVGHGAINAAKGFYQITGAVGSEVVAKGSFFTGSQAAELWKNYGLPTIVDARAGAGWAVDKGETNVDNAYVVCTTCHTPHSMYVTSAKLAGVSKGNVPTFFFIAAPYNPGANVADGTKASSATQFCRQCHFSGPGGANEASGISIPTAF